MKILEYIMTMPINATTIAFLITLMTVVHVDGQNASPEGLSKVTVGEGPDAVTILVATPKYMDDRNELLLELRNGYLGLIPVNDLKKQVNAWSGEHLHSDLSQISNEDILALSTNTLASGPFTIDLGYLPIAKLVVTPNGPLSDCLCVMPFSTELSPCAVELLGRYAPSEYSINLIVRDTPLTTVDALTSYAQQKGFGFTSRMVSSTEPALVSDLRYNK